jgi:hypothetical protein
MFDPINLTRIPKPVDITPSSLGDGVTTTMVALFDHLVEKPVTRLIRG